MFGRLCLFLCSLSLLGSDSAKALEDADLLPKGISRFRAAGVLAKTVKQKFDSNGQLTNLGGANKSLSFNDLASGNEQLAGLKNALDAVDPQLAESIGPWNLYQDISVQQNIFGGAYEYGLSKRWNIGVRFRVHERKVNSSFGVVTPNSSAIGDMAARFRSNSGAAGAAIANGLEQLQQLNTSTFANTIFTSKGYDVPGSFESMDLGYTELGGKYLVFKNDMFTSSMLLGVRLPTGKNPSLSNPLDTGTGGNAWGLGLEAFQEVWFNEFIGVVAAAKGKYFIPDTRDRAVPLNEDDALPSLVPEAGQVFPVERRLGSQLDAQLGGMLRIPGTYFELFGGYNLGLKEKDSFSGSKDMYYEGLAEDTDYRVSSYEAGVAYSTINHYRAGKFFLPMQISAQYNNAFSGKNYPKTAYGRVDLKVYF